MLLKEFRSYQQQLINLRIIFLVLANFLVHCQDSVIINLGSSSGTGSKDLSSPILVEPDDNYENFIGAEIRFAWINVENADYYELYFGDNLIPEFTGNDLFHWLDFSCTPEVLHWRVEAVNQSNRSTSEKRLLRLSDLNDPVWCNQPENVCGLPVYQRVQLCERFPSDEYAHITTEFLFFDGNDYVNIDNYGGTGTEVYITESGTGFYFKARLKTHYLPNCFTQWVESNTFYAVDAPAPNPISVNDLLTPSGGIAPYTDTLSWSTAVTPDLGYEVELVTGSCGGALVSGWPKTTASGVLNISTGVLNVAETYYWRVRPLVDPACDPGVWSECKTFEVG
jgi:hypothetical protein